MWKRGRVCAAVEMSLSIVLGHLRFNDAVLRFKEKPGAAKLPTKPKPPTGEQLSKLGVQKRRNTKKQYERDLAEYKRQLKSIKALRARNKLGKPVGEEFTCAKQFIADHRNKLLYSG